MATAFAPVVLFDGACPLCRREIAHYRRLRGADRLVWIDLSRDPAVLATLGIPLADAMARFHVRDRSGRWHLGAAAFVALWSHLPRYRIAALLVRGLHLSRPLNQVYERFADWRLRRRCNATTCNGPSTTRNAGRDTPVAGRVQPD